MSEPIQEMISGQRVADHGIVQEEKDGNPSQLSGPSSQALGKRVVHTPATAKVRRHLQRRDADYFGRIALTLQKPFRGLRSTTEGFTTKKT
jgi:hypothetical protein